MASNRHLGRIITLQSLYEYECRTKAGDATAEIDSIISKNIEPYSKALGDTEFVYKLARGVAANFDPLDEALRPLAPEWPIDTIAPIDRNVLRIGLYELTRADVPPKVAINEAVELAKAFGSDNSSRFVNGVLGTAFRQLVEEDVAEQASPDGQPGQSSQDTSPVQPAPASQPTSSEQSVSSPDQPSAPGDVSADQPDASASSTGASVKGTHEQPTNSIPVAESHRP